MTETDKPKFAEILLGLGEAFDRKPSAAATAIYWDVLKGVSLEAFRSGCRKLASEPRAFMPRPGEILEAARGGPAEDRALDEWMALRKATGSIGRYGAVRFRDRATAYAVRALGGWVALCDSHEAEHWLQKRFTEAWVSADARRHVLPEPEVIRSIMEKQPRVNVIGVNRDSPEIGALAGSERRRIAERGEG